MELHLLFFPVTLLVVAMAVPVVASGNSGVESVSYFHVVMDENGTILLGVEDANLIDSGYDLVPGYTYKFALKAHAWRDLLARTNFYGAGVKAGYVLVGIVAERPWSLVGLDVYLKVWDQYVGKVVYEKKLGHFGLTDTDKTWTIHVEMSMDCSWNVKVKVYDELGNLVREEPFHSNTGVEDVYWVPWDQDNEAGVYVLQTQKTQDCNWQTTTGTPITQTGAPTNPLDTNDKGGYNPLTDWKFLVGLGAVLVGLGILVRG